MAKSPKNILRITDLTFVLPDDFDGNIICPDYDRVCTGDVFCNELFSCLGIDVTKEPEKDSSSFCKLSMFAFLLLSIVL